MEEKEENKQELQGTQSYIPKNRQEEVKIINQLYGGKFLSFCIKSARGVVDT